MAVLSVLALAVLSTRAAAKVCTNVTVPVDINARQGVFDVPTLRGNLDATTFVQNFTNIGRNFTDDALVGYQTVTGRYNISAKFCRPDHENNTNPTVQVLTHGIGFDKSYWDIPFNAYNYSYIDVAVDDYSFSTVSIDRFGIGNSSKGDPLNLIQAPAEVSALYEITKMLRAGTFPTVDTAFEKVVHVGHSFGSVQSYLLSALDPTATDGLVLTGWSLNATWLPLTLADWNLHLARLNQPLRFGNISTSAVQQAYSYLESFGAGNTDLVEILDRALALIGIAISRQDIWEELATTEVGDIVNGINETVTPIPQDLPTGYLTWVDFTANQFAFLLPGFYDLGLGLFSERTKQPVTLGEIFTLGNGAPPTTPFSGPVQIVTGRQDAIFCGGDCLATGGVAESIPAMAQMAFPNASAFQAYIHPNTGKTPVC
ncbi:hypothetical protein H2201_007826 [Coniosporium apollinis]|uniref:AB hydrolase-1 domain-containing protein n=2 Tax=Coniosporium TaxID=2810619 RepID=A0ABQ9NN83_9PEZI|nr:hypothetical protein H2199_003407 [Cladosporium sp. JES 115]KAJ9658386.1 hypothetical protein H2201_007826 [Coniosporium apollinis]